MEHTNPPRILIVGLDRYGMRACVRLGLETTVICGAASWDQGHIAIPDEVTVLLVDDHTSAEAVLMALARAGLTSRSFDAVYTTAEDSLVMVGLLAAHLGLPAVPPEVAVRFRDKSVQKQHIRAAGLATAGAVVVDDVHEVSGVTELGFAKAVLKPVAGAATVRTSVVSSVADLRRRSAEYRRQRTEQRTFVLEEFVRGEEWIADGVLFEGELLFCAIGRYGDPCLTAVDTGRPLNFRHFDPARESWAYDRALPVITASLAALGLRQGMFHMELFHDPESGALTFGECAARRGGALVQEVVQAKFNVDLAETAIQVALGRRPELDVKIRPDTVGGAYLTAPPGLLLGCPSAAEVMARPGVEFVRIERPVGDRSPAVAGTDHRIGQFLVMADTAEELQERFDEVWDWFGPQLRVVPDGLKPRELRELQTVLRPGVHFGDALWQ
ncbi:hypothetical protein Q3V23_34965 [Streptomyces sp. VNUA116]|uniref:hypothetical protein n=1 Tax=Streptomyces sp. VNUA116 TaxID=3062449 RepID=UPI00267655D5|nr:hypothetical protein [Streptomyces sp. VNUA116]WKU48847.1 hypothetical protein Q3V23_34965 [Streptomyces sp. VNUA116]